MDETYEKVRYLRALDGQYSVFVIISNFIQKQYKGTDIELVGWHDEAGYCYLFDNPATGEREYLGFQDSHIIDIKNHGRIIFDTDWIDYVASSLDKVDVKLRRKYVDTVEMVYDEVRERDKKVFTRCFDEQTRKVRRLIASIGLNKYSEVKESMDESSGEDASENA